MAAAGLVAAQSKQVLAPFYVLKRVAAPAVTVSLGYWTNDADRWMEGDPNSSTPARIPSTSGRGPTTATSLP